MVAVKASRHADASRRAVSRGSQESYRADSCAGMSGVEKAALLLISIGASASAEVFKRLDRDQITKLSASIAAMPGVDDGRRAAVLEEFEHARRASAKADSPGVAAAVLESAMAREGERNSARSRSVGHSDVPARSRSFDDAASLDDKRLASMLAVVGHRTLAVALAGAEPAVRTSLMRRLPSEDNVRVLAEMDEIGPIRLRDIEEAQKRCLAAVDRNDRELGREEAVV